MIPQDFDLHARAQQAMRERGFSTAFPPNVVAAAAMLQPPSPPAASDCRNLLWSSIDNPESRDLDQVEYAESLPDGTIRLRVGIADVDVLVAKDSPIDQFAGVNTTSVYTGVVTFPMLPPALSNQRTSLQQNQDRQSIVIETFIGVSGEIYQQDVYPALLNNRAQLTYPEVGEWLAGQAPPAPAIAHSSELQQQLQLQHQAATRLAAFRKQQGALTFGIHEPTPMLVGNEVREVRAPAPNPAQNLIESFMVASNVAMAQFLKSKKSLSIRRVVRVPRRWDRIQALALPFGEKLPDSPDPVALSAFLARRKTADPEHFSDLSLAVVKLLGPGEYIVEPPGQEHEGHFGLAVHDYTHSTAPNRRYADLLIQRLLKATFASAAAPYDETALQSLAAHCTEREDSARKVERFMRKVLMAFSLKDRVGQTFTATVTGATPKGTYVRLPEISAEGRVIRGEHGIDVGDKIQVRLISVDPAQGFIDFAKI